ncbi:MAG: 50S ribosomal protein L35 [Nitrospirae bacterium]|nr:50S ribosomal protein L35 [Nitrospirota bacterium]
MPKLKSHRGAAKRFKFTGTGKIKRSKAFMGHMLTSKSSKRTRSLKNRTLLEKADYGKIKKLLPYG